MGISGAFLKQAIRGVYRNKRRTLYAILGVVLAISLIAGENIAIDSSVRAALYVRLETIYYEFWAEEAWWLGTPNLGSAAAALRNVNGVVAAEPSMSVEYGVDWVPPGRQEEPFVSWWISLIGVRPELEEQSARLKLFGDLALNSGEVAISRYMAETWQLALGDTLHLRGSTYVSDPDPYDNITVGPYIFRHLNLTISSIVEIGQDPYGGYGSWELSQPEFSSAQATEPQSYFDFAGRTWYNPVFIPLATAWTVFEQLLNFTSDYAALGLDPIYAPSVSSQVTEAVTILIDRDRFIFPASGTKTQRELTRLEFLLNQAASSHAFGVSINWELTYALEGAESQFLITQIFFLAASFPVIALGAYLTAIGNELSLRERRREIGILKSRGCSSRQVFFLLLAETLVLGTIAGVLGLLAGVGVSRLVLANILTFGISEEVEADVVALYISPGAIVFAVLFAIFVMFLVTYRASRRLSGLSIRESLQQYSRAELALHYRPGKDIAMVSIALFSLIGLWFFKPEMVEGGGGGFLFIILAIALLILIPFLAPVAPFLLIFGLTRLLTRWSAKVYDWASRLVRPLTPNLSHTIQRNISRHPRRASAVCLIIALALAFGLFITSTLETNEAYQRALTHLEIGSDIRVDLYSGQSGSFGAANLSALPDVAQVATAMSTGSVYHSYGMGFEFIGLEATNYSQVAGLTKKYLVDASVKDFRALGTGNYIFLPVIPDPYPEPSPWRVGDRFPIQLSVLPPNGTYTSLSLTYTILGFHRQLPGLAYPSAVVDLASLRPILSSFSIVGNQTRFFIDVEPQDRVASTAAALRASLQVQQVGAYVRTAQEYHEWRLGEDPGYKSFADFMMIEYGFAVVIITAGLGLIMFVAVLDREIELAGMMARGASPAQVQTLLVAEALVLMALGIGIGLGAGVFAAFSFNELFNSFIMRFEPGAFARELTIGPLTLSLVGITALALLFVAWLSAQRAGRIRVPEILRIRGG